MAPSRRSREDVVHDWVSAHEGETWGSWWRETAVYRWCESMAACVYEFAAEALIWAALPFQLLAQVCITHALRALGPQAGARGSSAARVSAAARGWACAV